MISPSSSGGVKNCLISFIAIKALLAFVTAFATCGAHCSLESNVIPKTLIVVFV